jgi:hypothetical protein
LPFRGMGGVTPFVILKIVPGGLDIRRWESDQVLLLIDHNVGVSRRGTIGMGSG